MRAIHIPLLALGAVLGYGFAFHSMLHGHHHHRHDRAAWERRAAEVCVGAAERLRNEAPPPKVPPVEP